MKFLVAVLAVTTELHNHVVNVTGAKTQFKAGSVGSALTKSLSTSVLLVKKVLPYRANLPVLPTSCLHYATKESWTEVQINIPDVLVPAEHLQHKKSRDG